jgi:hypothetical protein
MFSWETKKNIERQEEIEVLLWNIKVLQKGKNLTKKNKLLRNKV